MNARTVVSVVSDACVTLLGCSSTSDAANVAGPIETEGAAGAIRRQRHHRA